MIFAEWTYIDFAEWLVRDYLVTICLYNGIIYQQLPELWFIKAKILKQPNYAICIKRK